MVQKLIVLVIVIAAAAFVVYWLIKSLRKGKCACPESSACSYSENCPGTDRCHNMSYFQEFVKQQDNPDSSNSGRWELKK